MTNRILEIILKTKIDFTSTYVEISGGSGGANYFEIKPRDFIRFAKDDLKTNKDSGLVNAITNAKRAIDCQVDTIFKTFGIEFDNLPKATEVFINHIDNEKNNLPHKLKLIQALQIAPSGLTSKARTIRNKLEHYYEIPNLKEIKDAIEIAELFILSCESKTKAIYYDYYISDDKFMKSDKDYEASYSTGRFANSIHFDYDNENKKFEILTIIDGSRTDNLSIDSTNPEYYFLLRMLNTQDYTLDFKESLSCLLSFIKHPVPKEKINIAEMNN